MKMLINGNLLDKKEKIPVINPFNNKIVDHVPLGDDEDATMLLDAANAAKKSMNEMSSRKVITHSL